ncbi:heavy metal-associated domain-containing protein [Williamsia sp.]|uniref:heavy-metal-associated domain-containing protein n=1 Tax=Williamsia sp. TaxID=1872085 RepID=UPI002F925C49
MSTSTVIVTGMTCGHCASSVREEVGALDGVSAVEVNVETGKVTITSTAAIDPSAVTAAVAEAGYHVAD